MDELLEALSLRDDVGEKESASDLESRMQRRCRERAMPRPYSLPASAFLFSGLDAFPSDVKDTAQSTVEVQGNANTPREKGNNSPFADSTSHIRDIQLLGTNPHIARSPPSTPRPAYWTPPHPNTPVTPLSDLANDDITTTAPTLDLYSLQTSKHHPDFRIRNQPRFLRLSTCLSDLQLHLSTAYKTKDEAAFNDLHARITKAAEGLSSLAQPMPAKQADNAAKRLNGAEMSDVVSSMKTSEWYRAEHGGSFEEGEEHDVLSLGRVERAREAYKASLGTESSVEGDTSDEEGVFVEWRDESEGTALVNGPQGLASLHPSLGLALE